MLTDVAGGRDDATLPPALAVDGVSPRPVIPGPGATANTGAGLARRARIRWLAAGVATVVAVVVGTLAFAMRSEGDDKPSSGPTVVPGAGQVGSVPATLGPLGGPVAGPVAIQSVREFDPPPGNGRENPGTLGALTDGNPATAWTTVCYESKYLYPKNGVGVVLELSGPVRGQLLHITWPTSPWRVSIYTADQPGSTLAGWGRPVASRGSDAPGETAFDLGSSDSRYVLVWLTQVARSDACSANPYRGAIGELSVTPAA
jgi:hypothetical protein